MAELYLMPIFEPFQNRMLCCTPNDPCQTAWLLTGKGFMQYGYLKNYGSALFEVPIKDNTYRIFSKAHIV
jgi:hypothetical protein